MFEIFSLNSSLAGAFKELLPPAQRLVLLQMAPGTIAVGCVLEGRPIGLALAVGRKAEAVVHLVSLFVEPSFRGQGVGRRLLEFLENEIKLQGCQWLIAEFLVEKGSEEPIEHFLQRNEFPPTESAFYVFSAEISRIKELRWFQTSKLPADFAIFPWRELTAPERAEIERGLDVWYPAILSPFQDEAMLDLDHSIGLRYKGEVVGWLILQRLAKNRVLFKTLFVKRPFQRTGRGIAMLFEMIRQTKLAEKVPFGAMIVDQQNEAMLQMVRRRFASLLIGEEVLHRTQKSFISSSR